MVVWLRVTKDKYELPEYIADTAEELADMLGIRSEERRVGKECI